MIKKLGRLLMQVNPEAVGIYKDWMIENRINFALTALKVGLMASLLMMPLDFAFFGPDAIDTYTPFRVGSIVYLGLCLLYLTQRKDLQRLSIGLSRLMLLSTVVPFHALYVYFLVTAPAAFSSDVFIGTTMVIFFSTYMLHQYRTEHLIYLASSLALLITVSIATGFVLPSLIHLVVFHLVSLILFTIYRNFFIKSLIAKFKTLKMLVPPVVARVISASVGDVDKKLQTIFKPVNRPVVCLSSDWRGFQKLTKSLPPEDLSKLFEAYYDLVFAELARCVPSGTYYADWWADELFVVFYRDDDDKEKLAKDAASFAASLTTSVQAKLSTLGVNVPSYDIGLAIGEGILGLQGPKNRRKTTVIGEVAGIAKRLESQAKEMRMSGEIKGHEPILVTDQTMAGVLIEGGLLPVDISRGMDATFKDIKDLTVVLFHKDISGGKGRSGGLKAVA